MRKNKILCYVCVVFLAFLTACDERSDIYLEADQEDTLETECLMSEEQEQVEAFETQTMEEWLLYYVYICGAVEHPGVYALPEGSRIYEVIQMAGGLTEEADESLTNQAEQISDGMMIQIYTKEEAAEAGMKSVSGTAADRNTEDGRININTAGVTELMTLPGIGASKAEAILAYRTEHGAFSSIEDLMNVSGIKEGTFLQMKEHIKVNN